MTRRGARPTESTARRGAPPLRRCSSRCSSPTPTDRPLVTRHRVQRWLRAALERPAEITVRVVDAEEGRALNREFRAKDYATNVLTFDYEREPVVVADLVLCGPVLRREAAEQGIAVLAHYAHLVVHGALHAQGYDHEVDAEADRDGAARDRNPAAARLRRSLRALSRRRGPATSPRRSRPASARSRRRPASAAVRRATTRPTACRAPGSASPTSSTRPAAGCARGPARSPARSRRSGRRCSRSQPTSSATARSRARARRRRRTATSRAS